MREKLLISFLKLALWSTSEQENDGHERCTAHFPFENQPMSDFQIGNDRLERYTAHFLFENRSRSFFKQEMNTMRDIWLISYLKKVSRIWDLHAPGRPAGPAEVRAQAMAGKFSYGTSSHTHGYTIDFINPDCHLLGKKKKKENSPSRIG